MTEEEKEISDMKIMTGALEQRVRFLERTVYWFIAFVALNILGSFFLWIQSLKK